MTYGYGCCPPSPFPSLNPYQPCSPFGSACSPCTTTCSTVCDGTFANLTVTGNLSVTGTTTLTGATTLGNTTVSGNLTLSKASATLLFTAPAGTTVVTKRVGQLTITSIAGLTADTCVTAPAVTLNGILASPTNLLHLSLVSTIPETAIVSLKGTVNADNTFTVTACNSQTGSVGVSQVVVNYMIV